MSLLSTDITKVKRLSLQDITLEPPKEPTTPQRIPTEEEEIYSRMIANNPLIEELVSRLNLVSSKTGDKITKVNTII